MIPDNKPVRIISGILLLFIAYSCQRYFMPLKQNFSSPDESAGIISTKTPGKYIILHKGNKVYELKNMLVDKTNMTMSGKLAEVDPAHKLYIKEDRKNFTYNNKTIEVLNEVHFYVNPAANIDTAGTLVLPLNQLEKIEVIEHDKEKTSSSYVLGGIGVGVGVVVLAAVIVALTKESCPYVSVFDGEQYVLQGELFGGAINPKLERMDYIPLKGAPVNGEFKIRLSNELKEKQFTDFADLLVIEHPVDINVLPNADGKVYAISNNLTPATALLNNEKNVLEYVSAVDNTFCSFNDTSISSGINELRMSFQKNANQTKGKLLLNLKNSYWLDYLYGEFTRRFGSEYETWKEKQKNKPAAEMNKWAEKQQIPLSVYIETKNGWKEIQKLKTTGPLVNRNIVIPFEADDSQAQTINIKLSCGFMFWEVDYAAVDFSTNQPFEITRLKPVSATDENGKSVLTELLQNDKNYLAQPNAGNYAIIKYQLNQQPKPGNIFSVVLHTSGYYEPIREFTGKSDISFLKKFRNQGYFSAFSKMQYQKLVREQSLAIADKR